MLARNFMTATDLHITEKELDALIAVLGLFERNEVPHSPRSRMLPYEEAGDPVAFNFTTVLGSAECGTTACILGWARHIGGKIFWDEKTEPLRRLFYLDYDDAFGRFGDGDRITPDHAASALRNYLATGEPRWSEVLSD